MLRSACANVAQALWRDSFCATPPRVRAGAYGFCIIDFYEEVLECLGEEILPFTNMAAHVLHEAVTYNGGQPNRNLGDAFLCVWKPQVRRLADSPPRVTILVHTCGHAACSHIAWLLVTIKLIHARYHTHPSL